MTLLIISRVILFNVSCHRGAGREKAELDYCSPSYSESVFLADLKKGGLIALFCFSGSAPGGNPITHPRHCYYSKMTHLNVDRFSER